MLGSSNKICVTGTMLVARVFSIDAVVWHTLTPIHTHACVYCVVFENSDVKFTSVIRTDVR